MPTGWRWCAPSVNSARCTKTWSAACRWASACSRTGTRCRPAGRCRCRSRSPKPMPAIIPTKCKAASAAKSSPAAAACISASPICWVMKRRTCARCIVSPTTTPAGTPAATPPSRTPWRWPPAATWRSTATCSIPVRRWTSPAKPNVPCGNSAGSWAWTIAASGARWGRATGWTSTTASCSARFSPSPKPGPANPCRANCCRASAWKAPRSPAN